MRKRRKLNLLLATAVFLSSFSFAGAGTGTKAEAAGGAERKEAAISRTVTAPVIDGRLDEPLWSGYRPLEVRMGSGTFQDSSFSMLWDYKYLYVAVKVQDDTLMNNGSGYWFEQDHIGMFFDPTLHRSGPFVDNDMQIGFVYAPDSFTPSFYFGAAPNHAGKDEKNILRAISTTADGWTAEAAIPWDMLGFDPLKSKQFGFEIGVTDRDANDEASRSSYWSAYNSESFWNDTSGYGTITLSDAPPISGEVSDTLLAENFDSYESGQAPFGWISDVNAGTAPMTVTKDTYGDGRLVFDGNASGKQGRITAPVQWDNYTVEADLRFESVLNNARWGAIMFRVPSGGKQPYNQMAVRQNGTYEFAYRKPDGNWSVPASGVWQPLTLGADYTLKVRVFDNNVKEYIKPKDADDFTLLLDRSFTSDLLERGKIGLQGDQSKISFDNVKVTRVSAESMELDIPASVEALTGPVPVSAAVGFSDGIAETVPSGRLKLSSSDESVLKVIDGTLHPLKEGIVTISAVYDRIVSQREVSVTPSKTGPTIVSLKHDAGYLLAETGQTIDPNTIPFTAEYNDLTSKPITGGELSWSSSGGGVAVENGMLVVKQKGVSAVTAQSGDASVQLLIVAKNAADSEYVLYEESFDDAADGALPQGWIRIQGTTASKAGVVSGAFELDARTSPDNPSRVLLPEYLGLFGNYRIEADVTHLAANDPSRWHSIMYRVQNNNYPYYQMAVRQNATAANGVEFAERTPANQWNVPDRASFTENISADKMYRYKIMLKGNRVQEWIDDKLLIDNDLADTYSKGRIGLQADGSHMRVDNIKVSLQEDPLPPLPADRFVNVVEPETDIVLAPTVVTEIESTDDLAALSTKGTLPATAILTVNSGLAVTNRDGTVELGSLDSVIPQLGTKVMPAFYVKDGATVDALIGYLKAQELEDAFVISDNGELVKQARSQYPIIRGIVDFRGASASTPEQLMDIRRITNGSLAKIALLSGNTASLEQVRYLQKRLITVWALDEEAQPLSMHRLITAGVNGIVTDAPEALFDALKVYSGGTTLIRKPWVIGHRGNPSLAPENTMESFRLAYENGADILETDIYLTKDGHVVIMHDPTLDRTTNGTGYIEDYTLAELKQLLANKQFPAEYPDARIPTLAEMFDEFKGKDVNHFVEIKSYKPEIVDALVQLIAEKGVEDQVTVISFTAEQLKLLGQKMPGMSAGFLTGGYANEANVSKALRETLKVIGPLNTTFNTSYPGLGTNFMEAAKHRGMTIWPWTYRSEADYMTYFRLGTYGLTTDYAQWSANWAESLAPQQERYDLIRGTDLAISAKLVTYTGVETVVTPEVVLLDGGDAVEVGGNILTGKMKGTAHILLRYTVTMSDNGTYTLYTQPIEIAVREPYTLTVEPEVLTMKAGQQKKVKRVIYTSEGVALDVTKEVQFYPRDTSIAVFEDGKFHGLRKGSTVVDAKYGDAVAQFTVQVEAKKSGGSSVADDDDDDVE
ncbi:glycerophosphodiester phosphodiesterase family protein [Paenibacillus thermotolerans]|uniref:glycerophosphodiester phosphodiesterase family protein n=1 Tax=Paenibacillus thermotolerans TaxID=3027807 RepID=UPI002368465D|nr:MULTISPECIES: glycerophosphodiester phosphodiesterase family protein [unclassified Paenibacillus]